MSDTTSPRSSRAAAAASPSPNAAAIARAGACGPSALRDAVIANLKADAYARSEDIEADLSVLERQ